MNRNLLKRPTAHRRIVSALALAIAVVAAVAAPPPVGACSCISGSRMAMFDKATDVFLGKVVSGPPVAPPSGEATPSAGWGAVGAANPGKRHFQVEVSETLKGGVSGQVEIDTPGDEAACGYPFEVGQTYVIFAHHGTHGLHTDTCMGTVTGEGLSPTLEEVRRLSAFAKSHHLAGAPQ